MERDRVKHNANRRAEVDLVLRLYWSCHCKAIHKTKKDFLDQIVNKCEFKLESAKKKPHQRAPTPVKELQDENK